MSRYNALFARLKHQQEGAFVPFVTIGDPTPELSLQLIETLIENGADALELGIPFSDPLADGPTIQSATIRALTSGTTPQICFELLSQIRQKYPDIPIGLLMYANLVFANSIDHFYQQCAQAGVDSVLIADVPVDAAEDFRHSAEKHNIAPIFIAPPNADEATLKSVAQYGQGYTYLLSRAGVTGTETKAGLPLSHLVERLRTLDAAPALLGFGIATPEHVREAIAAGADGAISGSAVVNIIATHLDDPKKMHQTLGLFIRNMKAATHE